MSGFQAAPGPPAPGVRPPDGQFRRHGRHERFQGRLVQVYEDHLTLPNGHEARHESLAYPGAVTIVPLLAAADGRRELLVVEQFRSAVGGYIHEVPAGMLAPGEDPLACARRELEEETGYRAGHWRKICTLLPTPGLSAVEMHYFLAEDLRPGGRQSLDEAECLSVKRLPLDGLIAALVHGRAAPGIPAVVDAKLHMAVFYLGAWLRADGGAP